jgi:hypothetical protein
MGREKRLVSPRTALPLAKKYASLPGAVAKLEPSEVGTIFRHAKDPFSFFPSIGMFSVEFALGYCNNMTSKRDK